MISVILYGRNDNYGYNLHKRAALSLNCIAEVLNEADEILFVDYNTPDDFPTFPEAIQDTLTERARELLRVFRVRPFIHDRFKSKTGLLALEPIARNIAVRRSRSSSRWILSTNTDIIFILQRAGALTDLVRGLPRGFYHAPRIEIPEALWESLDRRNPKEIIQNVRDWGWSLHLNEIVFGSEAILYDGPGDFQLFEREDLIKYHGFNEEMLLGWHVDSNIAKRMGLVYGKVGDLGSEVYGYHCDHTRQITTAHSHMRTQNDWRRFVNEVETPALPEQANTWGCVDDEIEEIHLRTNPAQIYVKALKETIGSPLTKPRFSYYTESMFDKVDYDPPHIMPFLADLFVSSSRDLNVAWYAIQTETLSLFARIWQKLGFTGKIFVDESFIDRSLCHRSHVHLAPRDAILVEADVFVFDFATNAVSWQMKADSGDSDHPGLIGMCVGANDALQQTSANPRVILADVDDLRTILMHVIRYERERTNAGKQSRRIISLNAINNRFEGFVCQRIAAAYSPFSGRIRQGFVLPAPPLTPRTVLDCRGAGISMSYQDEGWSHPEDHGTWTDGPRAVLTAKLIGWQADDMILQVKAWPFLVQDRHPSLAVDVMANGMMVGRWTYRYPQDSGGPVVRSVRIPALLLAASLLTVELQIDEPAVPTVMGVHPIDDRRLGLCVSSISFETDKTVLETVLDYAAIADALLRTLLRRIFTAVGSWQRQLLELRRRLWLAAVRGDPAAKRWFMWRLQVFWRRLRGYTTHPPRPDVP
jgi:hypothetical protein